MAPLAPLPPVVRPASPAAQLEGVQTGIQLNRHVSVPTTAAPAKPPRAWPQPVYLLNSRIIVNELADINPQDIAAIEVYKGADAPMRWHSLMEHGIVAITLKPEVKLNLKTKSLAAIRRQAGAAGAVSFQLNGMRLEDSSLRIASAAIAGLEVLRDDSETVINIRLAPPKPSPPLPPLPDGSPRIYIRGVAGL